MKPLKTMLTALTLLLIILQSTPKALAQQVVQSVGQARLEYASSDHGVYRKVFHLAQINALQRLASASFPEAKLRLFQKYESEITSYENIGTFVLDTQEISPPEDTALSNPRGQNDKSIRLGVRSTISISAIDAFLNEKSTLSSAGSSQNQFGVLFFGRRIDTRQNFDERRVIVNEQDVQEDIENTIANDGVSDLVGITRTTTNRQASGGSTTQRRDVNIYVADIPLSMDLSSAIRQELVNAGFRPMEIEDIVEDYELLYLDELVDDGMIREDGTLPRRTLRGYQVAAIEEGWQYFGIGRVDVGLPTLDQRGTGILKVPATVTFDVFMEEGGRLKSVAVVAPETFWGDDPNGDQTVAEQRAYRLAVKAAMDTIVAQLQIGGYK